MRFVLFSYAPRAKRDKKMTTREKLAILNSLTPEDVKKLLSELSVSVSPAYNVTCGPASQYYRTMDGSCNNLQHPCWGKVDEPYQRWLPPAYDNGNFQTNHSNNHINILNYKQTVQN